jgi:HK97 family phage portal protein
MMTQLREWVGRAFNLGRTTPGEPGERTFVYLPMGKTHGVRVTHENALTFSAVWACIRAIAEPIASMPCHLMNEDRTVASDDPVDWLLYREPNPEMTAFTFRETIVAHALSYGNGYAEIVRDRAGRIAELWLITPDRVEVLRDDRGLLWYRVYNGAGEEDTYLRPEDVFHVHGLGFDGLQGYSVIGMHRRAIGLGMSMEETGTGLYANGAVPLGVVQYKAANLPPNVRKETHDEWNKFSNDGRRKIAVLGGEASFQPIGMSMQDAEFVASRQMTVEDICRIFRVPPHKVQHLLRSTNNNIEHQAIEYVTDTLMPWAARFEQESDRKLLGRNRRGRLYTKINFNALMRGDSAARADYYTKSFYLGDSINERREYEDLPSIGPDGDKRFVPANMVLLEKAGEEMEPTQPGSVEIGDESAGGENLPMAIASRLNGNGATNGKH